MADDRLSRDDWVKAGLKALAQSGASSLKAEPMAKALAVSRGSFYWHFADVDAFHTAVLERWRTVAYENIVADLESVDRRRLETLIQRAFAADTRLERAVRAWATSGPKAQAMVQEVDARRVQYLRTALAGAGFDAPRAAARAQIIYWTYLGYIFSTGRLTPAVRERLARELSVLAAHDRRKT